MMRLITVAPCAAMVMALLAIVPVSLHAFAGKDAGAPAPMTFATPDDAAAALLDSIKHSDRKRIFAILGPGSEALINSGDEHADIANRQKFVTNYEARLKLTEAGPGRDILYVGPNDWPLPIPLAQTNGRWRFDSHVGAQEVVDRRIGRNEIAAIRVALTYVDAQRAYFERSKQANGAGEYAQRLLSTPGQHDGLYWPAMAGKPESPFASLVAQAVEEGYPSDIEAGRQMPYQGYFFPGAQGPGSERAGRRQELHRKWSNDRWLRVGSLAGNLRIFRHHDIPGRSGWRGFSEGPAHGNRCRRGSDNALQS